MAIPRGTRIGVYEIIGMLGSGGMGEVYRARDTKLGRDVAIKVLANRVTDDPTISARIEREARLLASLNHSAIATIHGVEEWEGSPAIVMELVEGETLAVKLFEGPLPIPTVIRIAKQVSEALTAAHDRGIIHRDLKPANIHLRPDGAVKVLDFGLAKSLTQSDTQMQISQTVTTTGSIMGTAPYMSPEQARGQEVDRRSDIWSFGAVVYELLTGKRAFFGATPADTIVAVLSQEPDWDALPAGTPEGLRALLERCLQKDVRQRLRDLGDASFDYGATNPAFIGAIRMVRRRNFTRWMTTAAAIAALAGVIWVVALLMNRADDTGPLRKFEVQADGLGDDPETFAGDSGPGAGVVISPDGRHIVYPAKGRLWVRELSQLSSRELDGTEKAIAPTWSPDSRWVAYAIGDQLRKSPISGGPSVTITKFSGPFLEAGGAGWDADNQLTFSMGNGPIFRVSADGGDPAPLIDVDTGILDYHDVTIAAGRPIFSSHHTNQQFTIDTIENGKREVLFGPVSHVIRHPAFSRSGHLVYQRTESNPGIWGIPVDPRTLRARGEPFLVASSGLRPSVAADGTLVYVTDESWGQLRLSFIDRKGAVIRDVGEPRAGLRHPAISPKGDRIAFFAPADERDDLFMMDAATGVSTRVTQTGTRGDPEWDPDGTRLLYSCGASGAQGGICAIKVDGGGASDPVVIVPGASQADLSSDGKSIAYILLTKETRTDVWTAPLDGSSPPRLIRRTPAFDFSPRISPDGRWIAYASGENGIPQVFLTDYPLARRRWQVSVDSGASIEWNPRGGEMFYMDGVGRLLSVMVNEQGPSGKPREVLAETTSRAHLNRSYAVAADGESFVVVRDVDRGSIRPRITVVENWFAEFSPRQ